MSEISQGPPPIKPEGVLSGLKPGAIFIGVIVDYVATITSSVVLMAVLAERNSTDIWEETSGEALDAILASPEFFFWGFVLGALCTVFGGFIGAWRAARHHLRHGAFVALGSLLVSLLGFLLPSTGEPLPVWYEFLGILLMIPCGVAGGWIAEQLAATRAA